MRCTLADSGGALIVDSQRGKDPPGLDLDDEAEFSG